MTFDIKTTSNKSIIMKVVACLLLIGLSLESNAFGSLFTSPQQREILNQQRAQGKMFSAEPKTISQTQISPSVDSAKEQKVFFNGYVIRKSGSNTAWANQKKLNIGNNKKLHNGISAKLDEIQGTSVPIKTSKLSNPTWLQPGQFFNQKTKEITENYHIKRSTIQVKKNDGNTVAIKSIENTDLTDKSELEKAEDQSMELE